MAERCQDFLACSSHSYWHWTGVKEIRVASTFRSLVNKSDIVQDMYRPHLSNTSPQIASNFGNTGSRLVAWKLKSRLVSVKHSEDVLQANPREHPVRWRSKVLGNVGHYKTIHFWGVWFASFISNSGAHQPRWASKKKCCYLTLIAPVLGRKAF